MINGPHFGNLVKTHNGYYGILVRKIGLDGLVFLGNGLFARVGLDTLSQVPLLRSPLPHNFQEILREDLNDF